jgi:hypothetical protein
MLWPLKTMNDLSPIKLKLNTTGVEIDQLSGRNDVCSTKNVILIPSLFSSGYFRVLF